MEIDVNNQTRMVYIWITSAEKKNTNLSKILKQLSTQNCNQKYKTIVYYSGCQSLIDCTKDLLLHNRYLATANNDSNLVKKP